MIFAQRNGAKNNIFRDFNVTKSFNPIIQYPRYDTVCHHSFYILFAFFCCKIAIRSTIISYFFPESMSMESKIELCMCVLMAEKVGTSPPLPAFLFPQHTYTAGKKSLESQVKRFYLPCITSSESLLISYKRMASRSSSCEVSVHGSPSSSTHFIVNT